MKKTCTICGSHYKNIAFKGGYICEDCVNVIKDFHKPHKKIKTK